MTRICVTGANGQLGSELQNLAGPAGEHFNFDFTDIDELDLTQSDQVEAYLTNVKPHFVINCAAYTAVDQAESDREKAFLINREVPKNLGALAVKLSFKLVHISTDYVFPGNQPIPLKEDAPTRPYSVYGTTKLAGEEQLQKNEQAMIIRTSWLYSTHGKNFVKTMVRLMQEKKQLKVVFDQTGSPTYARDLAGAIFHIIQQVSRGEHTFEPGIYHYSNEGVASWYDLAMQIRRFLGANCQVEPVYTEAFPLPAPRPVYSVMNKKKIRDTYHLDIPHWYDSLEECLRELKTQSNEKNTK